MSTITYVPRDPDTDSAVCIPRPGDVQGDPSKCVIHNYLEPLYPWMRHVTVGAQTIRAYDYRCEHNPEGLQGRCQRCPGRILVWATPLPIADTIRRWDRTGEVVEFPAFLLREDEARVMLARQDPVRKARAMKLYNEAVRAGEHQPTKRSGQAKARAKSNRRRG